MLFGTYVFYLKKMLTIFYDNISYFSILMAVFFIFCIRILSMYTFFNFEFLFYNHFPQHCLYFFPDNQVFILLNFDLLYCTLIHFIVYFCSWLHSAAFCFISGTYLKAYQNYLSFLDA